MEGYWAKSTGKPTRSILLDLFIFSIGTDVPLTYSLRGGGWWQFWFSCHPSADHRKQWVACEPNCWPVFFAENGPNWPWWGWLCLFGMQQVTNLHNNNRGWSQEARLSREPDVGLRIWLFMLHWVIIAASCGCTHMHPSTHGLCFGALTSMTTSVTPRNRLLINWHHHP